MRVKSPIVRSGMVSVGAILFGAIFCGSRVLLTRYGDIAGAKEQNGWQFVRHVDGTSGRSTPPNAFLDFFDRLLGRSHGKETLPPYPALDLLVPPQDVPKTSTGSENAINALKAEAVASNGDRFPLLVEEPHRTDGKPKTKGHVFVQIPDVPDNYRWLTITVSDSAGRSATWRVRGLTRLTHTPLTEPLTAETATPLPGVTLEARAWWDVHGEMVERYSYAPHLPVNVEVRGEAPKANRRSDALQSDYDLSIRANEEWALPPSFVKNDCDWTPYDLPVSSGGGTLRSRPLGSVYKMFGCEAPYPSAQHFVKLQGTATRNEMYTQTVQFHQVPLLPLENGWQVDPNRIASLTTRNGMKIRFLPFPRNTGFINSNHAYYRFKIEQQGQVERFPGSSYTYGVPATLAFADDVEVIVDDTNIEDKRLHDSVDDVGHSIIHSGSQKMPLRVLKSRVIPTLTITVYEMATVQQAPYHFVVPVAHEKPKEAWVEVD